MTLACMFTFSQAQSNTISNTDIGKGGQMCFGGSQIGAIISDLGASCSKLEPERKSFKETLIQYQALILGLVISCICCCDFIGAQAKGIGLKCVGVDPQFTQVKECGISTNESFQMEVRDCWELCFTNNCVGPNWRCSDSLKWFDDLKHHGGSRGFLTLKQT